MKKSILFYLFILVCIPVSTVLAFTITEGLDLPNTNSATRDLGNFAIGINTVSGSVARDLSSSDQGDYGDFWDAGLLPGMQITGIEFDLLIDTAGAIIGSVHAMVADGFIYNGTSTIIAQQWLGTNGTYSLYDADPLNADQYYFGAAASIGSSIYRYNYEWRIIVASVDSGASQVPEPATVFLFGLGILGLAGLNKIGIQHL